MIREEAIDWLARVKSNTVNHTLEMPLWWNEPLAEALDMAIKALEQEPTTKNDLGVDAVSRADARSLICEIDIKHHTFGISRKAFKDLYNGIDELPPVTPQQRKGYLSIDDVMSVFDDFMCGEVDEDGTETFLEMLKDKGESEDK